MLLRWPHPKDTRVTTHCRFGPRLWQTSMAGRIVHESRPTLLHFCWTPH